MSVWLYSAQWYWFVAVFAGTCVSSWIAGFIFHSLLEKPLRVLVAAPHLVEPKPTQGLPT